MPNFQNLQFGASGQVLLLRNGVCDDDLIQGAGVDPLNCVTTQDAMRDKREHLRRTLLLQKLSRTRDGIRRVGQIINQDRSAAFHIPDKHHRRVLTVRDSSRAAFLFFGNLSVSRAYKEDMGIIMVLPCE